MISKNLSVSSGYSTENGQMATGGAEHLESFWHIVECDSERADGQFENISPADRRITKAWVSLWHHAARQKSWRRNLLFKSLTLLTRNSNLLEIYVPNTNSSPQGPMQVMSCFLSQLCDLPQLLGQFLCCQNTRVPFPGTVGHYCSFSHL